MFKSKGVPLLCMLSRLVFFHLPWKPQLRDGPGTKIDGHKNASRRLLPIAAVLKGACRGKDPACGRNQFAPARIIGQYLGHGLGETLSPQGAQNQKHRLSFRRCLIVGVVRKRTGFNPPPAYWGFIPLLGRLSVRVSSVVAVACFHVSISNGSGSSASP
jgi:hypothetical protein